MSTAADLSRRFTFHPPTEGDGRAEKHDQLRRGGLTFAELLVQLVPDTPERRRALDAVDDAVMLGNAGLARGTHQPINSLVLGKLATGHTLKFFGDPVSPVWDSAGPADVATAAANA